MTLMIELHPPEQIPSVLIIVLTWNNFEDTAECLQSLRALDYPNYGVALVDNGSTDGSIHKLRTMFPEAHLILNHNNLGYAEGNNMGIRYALSQHVDYVLLLNNDLVVAKNLVSELINTYQTNASVGIVGGVNYYYDQRNKIQSCGGMIDWIRGGVIDCTRHQIDEGQFENIREVDTVLGSCLLISTEAIKTIGLMENKYFLNCEETDWCCHAKKCGYKVYSCMGAKVWHKVSVSARKSETGISIMHYYVARNRYLFLIRNSPRWMLFISLPRHTLRTIWEISSYLIKGHREEAKLLSLALVDGLTGRYGYRANLQ